MMNDNRIPANNINFAGENKPEIKNNTSFTTM